MLELLFLFLPVAAGYGYVMGRNSLRKVQRKQSSILSKHYYKGLNLLLSDQPDKAVDTLIKMISLNTDTVETHIAMGNFFRHRGELDRAIRVHQNLISRDEISIEQQASALKELGIDYMLAGFLERAEGVFLQLLQHDKHFNTAQTRLFKIYQVTKEWGKAIELALKSLKITPNDPHLHLLISHFYCEQAELSIKSEDIEQANGLLKQAISYDINQIRAWLQLGKIALLQKRYDDAYSYLKEVPQRDIDWLSEAIPLLEECAKQTDNWDTIENIIEPYWQKSASSYIAKAQILLKNKDSTGAIDMLVQQLQKQPTMRGFKSLMSLYLNDERATQTSKSLNILQDLIDKQIQLRPKYRCHSCGFAGRQLHWLCPSCRKWSVIKPIKGLDGE